MRNRIRWSLLAGALVAALPGPAAGQGDLAGSLAARSVPNAKRSFEETWLLPKTGATAPDASTVTRFAGRATIYQERGKERIELRAVSGGELADPIVVVSDGRTYHLVTKVGATPLVGSAAAGDALLKLVLAGPAGEAPPHRAVPATAGGVAAVVLRHARQGAFDGGQAFALKLPQVGGGLLRTGLSSFSAAQDPTVTASAGARGVDQVRTANGMITVTPDPAAVSWMEALRVSPVAFEEFKATGRLAPYDALPEEGAAPAAQEGAR